MKITAQNSNKYRTAAVVVTYGSRLSLFTQTIEKIMCDEHVVRLIVVDNASSDSVSIETSLLKYGERVRIIHNEKNLGSAGGFSSGISAAREEDVDYIYLSDDDVIISENFIESFRIAHIVIGSDQTVLCARRKSFWAGTDVHYSPNAKVRPRKYFNIFNFQIIIVFLKALFKVREQHIAHESGFFFPIIPARGWAYAGVFIPILAAKKSPLPDRSLGLYLDDLVYSWGVIDSGYPSFALIEPHLVDIELTHADAHTATGLFSSNVSSTKIYYETRNRVRVSLKYGHASPFLLGVQVILWCVGVFILSIFRYGINRRVFLRMRLIIEALLAGFFKNREMPKDILVRI